MAVAFFGPLVRRASYETRAGGGHYDYTHYRAAIAEDCKFRCVYCDLHEDKIGGREAMEMDHFRPWQKTFGAANERRFEHLRNEPTNLVHSCGVCNGYKRAFWPSEDPEVNYDNEKGWIEPFDECRADFFNVEQDGTLVARKAPGSYTIKKLRLDRPLLKRLREKEILRDQLETELRPKWEAIVAEQPGTAHAQTAQQALLVLALFQ
jgi:hypothetical protein